MASGRIPYDALVYTGLRLDEVKWDREGVNQLVFRGHGTSILVFTGSDVKHLMGSRVKYRVALTEEL